VHIVPLDKVDHWLAQKQASGLQIEPRVFAGLRFAERHSGAKGAR
jgi:hypothetical protein